jgi:hypothetical protein
MNDCSNVNRIDHTVASFPGVSNRNVKNNNPATVRLAIEASQTIVPNPSATVARRIESGEAADRW